MTTRTDRPVSYTSTSQREPAEDSAAQSAATKRHSLIVKIGVPVLLMLLGWAAKPLIPVTQSKYEKDSTAVSTRIASDSARRETRYSRDSIDRLNAESRRDSIAESIARKVDILVCRPLPPAEREACLKK